MTGPLKLSLTSPAYSPTRRRGTGRAAVPGPARARCVSSRQGFLLRPRRKVCMGELETSGKADRRRRRRTRGTKRARTVRVISWDGIGWGIDIDNGNGRHKAYAVGSREAAEKEVHRVRSGGRAPTRKQVAQLFKSGSPSNLRRLVSAARPAIVRAMVDSQTTRSPGGSTRCKKSLVDQGPQAD